MRKRIIAFLTACIVAFTTISMPVIATEETTETAEPYSGTLRELLAIVRERVEETLFSGETETDLSDLQISFWDYRDLTDLRYYIPYLDHNLVAKPERAGDYWKTIAITNPYDTTAALNAHITKIDKALEELIAYVNQGKNDEEKVFLFFEYMSTHYEYDYAAEADSFDGVLENYTPYCASGLLQNASGVCNAYAHLMMYVLHDMGIECHRVSCPSMNHTWNLIKIDDEFYHVDATFGANKYGFVNRADNFMLSDEAILKTSTHGEWTSIGIMADSTKYDAAYWRTVNSQIIYEGDMAYYVTGSKIVCRNRTTNEVVEFKDLNGAENCNVFLKDGMMYYNTDTEIRKTSFDGNTDELVFLPELTEEQSIYGCREKNGNLEYGVKTSGSKELPEHYSMAFPDVPVAEKLIFETEELEIGFAESEYIDYTLAPSNSQSVITWTSSDPAVVSVDEDGMMTAHQHGSVTLKATLENGVETSCTVTVGAGEEFMIVFEDRIDGAWQTLDFAPITVKMGEPCGELPVLEDRAGYSFSGWSTSRFETIAEGTLLTKKIAKLRAQWSAIEYPITYEYNGGEWNRSNASYYTVEFSRNLYPSKKEGCLFAGWYEEPEFLNQIAEISNKETGPKTVYAKWVDKASVIAASYEELMQYKNLEDYRENEQEEIKRILTTAKAALENATTLEEVETLVAGAKKEMNFVKSAVQLEEEASWGPVIEAADDSWDIPVEILIPTAGSEQTYGSNDYPPGYVVTEGPVELALDNDPVTIWHTLFSGTTRDVQWVQFELNEAYKVKGLRYLPRAQSQGYGSDNGVITEYIIQISNDGENWQDVDHECWEASNGWKLAWFKGENVKYVRLKVENAKGSIYSDFNGVYAEHYHASAAEIRLVGGKMYSLSYELAGGVNHDDNPTKYAYDTIALELKPASKEGVVFEGWYVDSALTEKTTGIAPLTSGEQTVYANYISKEEATEGLAEELENYKNPEDYREAQKEELAEAIAAGKAAVDAATNVDAIQEAMIEAKAVLDAIKTDAQLTEEEEAAAAAAFEEAKEKAKEELAEYKNVADYREAQKKELADAIGVGIAAIEDAENIEELTAALSEAKAVLDAIKTDAQLTEEEEAAAAAAFEKAKEKAKEELAGYKNAADYREAQKKELADAIGVGIASIEDAENIEALTAALSEAKAVLDAIKTDAQLKEEEKVSVKVTEVFTDVKENGWYVDSVQYVYDNSLMNGSNGKFNPTADITRAQLVTTLYRLAGSPEVTDRKALTDFSDVVDEKYYTDAVCWAYAEGIATGNNGKFDPNGQLTRQQMAAFFFRLAEYQGDDVNGRTDISDMVGADKVSGYAKDAVEWAVGAGLISGSEKTVNGVTVNDLNPRGNTTRAQVATILMRFCEK